MDALAPFLAFDFASPRASVAVESGDGLLATRNVSRLDGEPQLLALVDETLTEARIEPRQLGGVIALAGPGSFTGLRIACATALGLGRALGVPAGGVSTLEVLAHEASSAGTVLAVVDALRGEWFVQAFHRGYASRLVAAEEIRVWAPGGELPPAAHVVGFDSERFVVSAGLEVDRCEPRNLAAAAAKLATAPDWSWRADLLEHPLYLRAPATTRQRH